MFSKILLDNGKEVENFMQKAYEEKYVHTKELVNIDRYFEGEEVWKLKKGCVNKKKKLPITDIATFGGILTMIGL